MPTHHMGNVISKKTYNYKITKKLKGFMALKKVILWTN